MKKVNINILGDKFWYVPSVFTTSKRKWAQRPYTNFKKLLKNENLINENFLLSLNGDDNFKYFRIIQSIHEIDLFMNKKDIEIINNNGILEYKIPRTRVTISFDKKSLNLLKKGLIPYYSKDFLKKNYQPTDDFFPCLIISTSSSQRASPVFRSVNESWKV